jgi:hypothetical protein
LAIDIITSMHTSISLHLGFVTQNLYNSTMSELVQLYKSSKALVYEWVKIYVYNSNGELFSK